ncbi:MAG: L7Ae/L30e/S12e/Gadd45 family ribosomal protein [Ruminococcus sp.]|jgi:ribosomal protein L7Ae-like RNA K-turn-binding protein
MGLNERKVLSLVGLAAKAGKVASGEFSTEKAVKTKKAYLVIVAEEASGNTKKKFQNMCIYYKVPCYFFGEKESLGKAIGKEFRASLAILDENLGKAVEGQLLKVAEQKG